MVVNSERPTHPATQVINQILKTAQSLRGALNDHLDEFHLNDARFAVLQALDDCDPTGCTQTQLATELDQSESNICTLVERMRQDGLLYRHRSKSDRRKRILLLTEKSRRILAAVHPTHEARMRVLLRSLSAEEQRRLLQLLIRLSGVLAEESGGRRAGKATARTHSPSAPHYLQSMQSSSPRVAEIGEDVKPRTLSLGPDRFKE